MYHFRQDVARYFCFLFIVEMGSMRDESCFPCMVAEPALSPAARSGSSAGLVRRTPAAAVDLHIGTLGTRSSLGVMIKEHIKRYQAVVPLFNHVFFS